MDQNATSITTGLVVTALALIPLMWFVMSNEQGASTESAASPTVPTLRAPAPDEVVVTTPPPEIEGISEAVARVLVVNGFAAEETVEGIPDSVVRTLANREKALTIAEDG